MNRNTRSRVLIVTYYWPPSGGGGVQRWLKLTRYLPEFGVEPTVYTPSQPDFQVLDESLSADVHPDVKVWKRKVWEPYGIFRLLKGGKFGKDAVNAGTFHDESTSWLSRLALWIRGNIFLPDPRVFWVRPSVRYLSRQFEKEQFDCLITTGPPHSMHLIGLKLKRKYPHLRWIADFRDPWLDPDFLKKFNPGNRAMRRHIKMENAVLKSADVVLSVSPSWAEELRNKGARAVEVLTNGYDPEDFKGFQPQSPDRFTLFYGGIITSMRQPHGLWTVLEEWLDGRPEVAKNIDLVLAGTIDPSVHTTIGRHLRLNQVTHYAGYLSHQEILKRYESAAVLLLLLNRSANSAGHIPGKFFEYNASGKPVLALGNPEGDVAGFLTEHGNGVMVSYGDQAGMRRELDRLYDAWKDRGHSGGKTRAIADFDRRVLAGKLAGIIHQDPAGVSTSSPVARSL